MNNLSCLEETRKQVESLCGDDGLNLLINNAGKFFMRFLSFTKISHTLFYLIRLLSVSVLVPSHKPNLI